MSPLRVILLENNRSHFFIWFKFRLSGSADILPYNIVLNFTRPSKSSYNQSFFSLMKFGWHVLVRLNPALKLSGKKGINFMVLNEGWINLKYSKKENFLLFELNRGGAEKFLNNLIIWWTLVVPHWKSSGLSCPFLNSWSQIFSPASFSDLAAFATSAASTAYLHSLYTSTAEWPRNQFIDGFDRNKNSIRISVRRRKTVVWSRGKAICSGILSYKFEFLPELRCKWVG